MTSANLWAFWTDDNPLSANRERSLLSMHNSGLELVIVNRQNIGDYVDASDIHPAYWHLNAAHKADFLRCYFMHKYGGAYCDIKTIANSWVKSYNKLIESPVLLCSGYREISPGAVANPYASSRLIGESLRRQASAYFTWKRLRARYRDLIGCGAFIFKQNSPFTHDWWFQLNNRLDHLCAKLKENPAVHPKERYGDCVNGKYSKYPVPWTYLLGDIFHPLCLKYSHRIDKELPPPAFRTMSSFVSPCAQDFLLSYHSLTSRALLLIRFKVFWSKTAKALRSLLLMMAQRMTRFA